MRSAVVATMAGVALAVGVPTTWALTRPAPAAGPPVEQVVGAAPEPTPAPAPPTTAGTLPEVSARDAAPSATTAPPAPVRVVVPSAGIDAAVDGVGVEPDGWMEIPEDVDRVGWYRFGPAPSTGTGSTVLAGHVDDAEQGAGALEPLRGVEVGDEVLVDDAAGAQTRWRVVARQDFDKQAVPLDELFARTGPARLVLITCGGEFLSDIGSYTDNVVVVAEPV